MSEALTGRKKTFFLFPISYKETVLNSSTLEAKRMLDTRLIYGLYPEVVNNPGNENLPYIFTKTLIRYIKFKPYKIVIIAMALALELLL